MNNIDIHIRLARTEDIKSIVDIIRQGLPNRVLDMIIYGCDGIYLYLEEQIKVTRTLTDTSYYVAVVGGEVVGVAELKYTDNNIFLNQISVSPNFRTYGIGTKLLKESVLQFRNTKHKSLMLDVFTDNTLAEKWYKRLGFDIEYSTEWWSIPTFNNDNINQCRIIGYPQFNVCQSRFGFSQLKLLTPKGEVAIGVIGEKWYRISDVEILSISEVSDILYRIDTKRRVLGIFKEGLMPITHQEKSTLAANARRMSIDINKLISNITNKSYV